MKHTPEELAQMRRAEEHQAAIDQMLFYALKEAPPGFDQAYWADVRRELLEYGKVNGCNNRAKIAVRNLPKR